MQHGSAGKAGGCIAFPTGSGFLACLMLIDLLQGLP